MRAMFKFVIALAALLLAAPCSNAQTALFSGAAVAVITPPTPDVNCLADGTYVEFGGGTCIASPAPCDGVSDYAAAFREFKSWALSFQAAHPGILIQQSPPSGTCQFISQNVNTNNTAGIKRLQIVANGTTFADLGGLGGGFAFGGTGIRFDDSHSARFATISAGATSITLLDTSQCSLFADLDWTLLAGIDPQGFGDPPNPQIFEYIRINSTAACAGTGVITLLTPTLNGYKSTWPLYNAGSAFVSDQGGPATAYALNQGWDVEQAWYDLTVLQENAQTNANGRSISFYNLSVPPGIVFCPIPSQNVTWTVVNWNAPGCLVEVDKLVQNLSLTNATLRRLHFQSGSNPQQFTCTNCNISPIGIAGTAGNFTLNGGTIAELQLGTGSYGIMGSFSATNTVISSLVLGGSSMNKVEGRGVWSSGTFTVPRNMSISSAADNGAGLIRLTVNSSAGWSDGLVGDGPTGTDCEGTFAVDVINATTVDLLDSTFVGTCSGAFGSLPLTWAVPGGYVYFSPQAGANIGPLGPVLQVADLSVGANNATVVHFNQGGAPYSGGLPTMPGTSWSLTSHMAPAWSCIGCTGPLNVLDVTGAAQAGLPFGSMNIRTLTAATSGQLPYMGFFGSLTSLAMDVTAACSGAANVRFEAPMFITELGASTTGLSWNPTVNGLITGLRTIGPTSASGGQSGDSLALPSPGADTWLVTIQMKPEFSNVGNCPSASTTITVTTDQGVTYPYLLKRDVLPEAANDNTPMFVDIAA